MPHSLSAKKRVRQNATHQERNKSRRSTMRTAIRRVREAAAAGDAAKTAAAVQAAYKSIDKAAKTNAIHANTAARRKALVTRIAAGA